MNLNEIVFIGNIPKPASAEDLASFLKDAGNVIKVSFMRENRNDCRTKIGFVLFENEMQALKACNFDQTIFQWNRIIVMIVNDERHFLAGHTVMVRNISYDTSEEDLYESFGRYGMIENVQIPTNNYAYVEFKEKSAAIASQRLNNTTLGKNRIAVKVMQCNTRVRLEDLDSFKTPRVYNELMDAKIKYNYQRDKETAGSATVTAGSIFFGDYEDDDDDDNRVYDPISNRFFNRPKEVKQQQLSNELHIFHEEDNDEDLLMPPSVRLSNRQSMIDLVSPNLSPEPDPFDVPRQAPEPIGEIRRRDMDFSEVPICGTSSIVDVAVKVENIPRDVCDEDVVKYFDQFGHIVSVEIANSQSCLFTKNYTVVFQQENVASRVLECFMRKCEFSGVVCTMFTMRVDEVVLDDPRRCVLVDYISDSVVYEDVVDAFRNIGDVIYVKKTMQNSTPSVVLFRDRIVIERALTVTRIDGDRVRVVPFSTESFREYTNDFPELKKDAKPYTKKPLKNVRMMDIEMKELQEKTKYMIIRTIFNPNYRSPEPGKLKNEVIIYNCPVRTTLKDLRRHFINVAFVTEMRYEQHAYDTNTWKVYASFANFLDAFNAVRLRGAFQLFPIFKHMATDKPKLDTPETVEISTEQDDISVNKMYTALASHGAVTFVDKISHNMFIAICRDAKMAKKLVPLKNLARSMCKVTLYQDVLHKQNTVQHSVVNRDDRFQQYPTPSSSRAPVPMDEIIAIQQRIMDDDFDVLPLSQVHGDGRRNQAGRGHVNDWELDFNIPGRSSLERRNSVDMDLADDQQERLEYYNQQLRPPGCMEDFASDSYLDYTNPPAPNEAIQYGGLPFQPGWASGGPMLGPQTSLPVQLNRPVIDVASMGSNMTGGPLIPNITIHHIQPNAVGSVPQQGDLRDYLAEKRNTRPTREYENTEDFDRRMENINSDQPKTSGEIDRIEDYIRAKEREIQHRLKALDKKLTNSIGNIRSRSQTRERSLSPTDHKARARIAEIRDQKIEVSKQMASLRKRDSAGYKNSHKFLQLCETQSALDKEQCEIKRQLEAKEKWLLERDRSLSRERDDKQKPAVNPKKQQHNVSSSRARRRSFSRERYRRSRSDSSSDSRRHRYRSPSRETAHRRRFQSNEKQQHYHTSERRCKRRPESLMREMRQLGLPHESKADQSVFVGNISEEIREDELRGMFSRYGRIVNIDFNLRERCNEIYINYYQREEAFKALEMNRVKICGKRLRVSLNCRKPANREGYTVIVETSEPVVEIDLYTCFEGCGNIEFIWHYDFATVATITFERPESVLKALAIKELRNRIPIIVREYLESER